MKKICFSLILTALLMGGCATTQEPGLTLCKEPRPNICTREYPPVWGEFASGEKRTFSNGCSACAVEGVAGHRPGRCEGERAIR